MTALTLLVIPLFFLAMYASALSLALISYSPTAFAHHAAQRQREEAGPWLQAHLEQLIHATSMVRIALGVSIFTLILVELVGLGEQVAFQLGDVVTASLITVAVIWVSTTVFARAIARYMPIRLLWMSFPLLRVLSASLGQATHLVRWVDEAVRRLAESPQSAKEQAPENALLRQIQDTSLKAGLDDEAREMLENVVEFRSTDVGAVMTPRTDIEGLELTNDVDAIRELILRDGHSRIPVYEDNLDHIKGILYVKDLVEFLGKDVPQEFRLEEFLRKPMLVPDTRPVHDLLTEFQRSEVHLAIVVDEYGGTAGLVTIEDLLEEIVGEIYDEHEPEDEEEPALTPVDEGRAEVDGRYHIDDLNDEMALELPEDEEYDTVAGFMLAQLGHVPSAGESIETDRARFTAIATTATQVEKIAIELVDPANAGSGEQETGLGDALGEDSPDSGQADLRQKT